MSGAENEYGTETGLCRCTPELGRELVVAEAALIGEQEPPVSSSDESDGVRSYGVHSIEDRASSTPGARRRFRSIVTKHALSASDNKHGHRSPGTHAQALSYNII